MGSYAGRATDDDGNPVDPVERYMNGVVIHGTPDMVVDQLQELQEQIGLDYLLCSPLSHCTFLLFTEQVLPHLV